VTDPERSTWINPSSPGIAPGLFSMEGEHAVTESKNNHEKVWGREIWLTNNELYCAKRLELKGGYRCSMHHHALKDETFIVESGIIILEFQTPGDRMKSIHVARGDSVRIIPGTPHRFWGLGDAVILEVSTHHDEDDSCREPGEDSGTFTPEQLERCIIEGRL